MTFGQFRLAVRDANNVHDPRLFMAREGPIEVRYAPFDYVNPTAKIVILGITPGEQQANAAILEAGRALRRGESDANALTLAKTHASFAGPMRTNLIKMLDEIGVNAALGIRSCGSLWAGDVKLIQFASALRYPVFINGKNYTGSAPKMMASPLLRQHLFAFTALELKSLPDALVLPLGPTVVEACRFLAQEGSIDPNRIITGVPHPSGANGERIAYFLGEKPKSKLSNKTNADIIDTGRNAALQTVEKWKLSSSA